MNADLYGLSPVYVCSKVIPTLAIYMIKICILSSFFCPGVVAVVLLRLGLVFVRVWSCFDLVTLSICSPQTILILNLDFPLSAQ